MSTEERPTPQEYQDDLARISRGQTPVLGYVFIDRDHHDDAVVVFPSPEAARAGLNTDPLVDDLSAEDSLDTYIPASVSSSDLDEREVILR